MSEEIVAGNTEAVNNDTVSASDANANNGNNVNTIGVNNSGAFVDLVPAEYRDKPYFQNIMKHEDPQQELFKQFAGIQEVLGRRPGNMPGDDASDDDWKNWVETIQPKDVSVYGDLKPQVPEEKAHLKELLGAAYADETLAKIMGAAREAGLHKRQLTALSSVMNEINMATAEKMFTDMQQAQTQTHKEFETMFAETFGSDKDKVLDAGRAFLMKNTPENLKKHVDSLPNEALAVLAGFAYNVHKQYGTEDSIPHKSTSVGSGNDLLSLKDEMTKAMTDKAYRNAMDPRHENAVEQVRLIGEKIARITKPGSQ